MHVRLRRHQGRFVVGGYEHVFELSDTATFIWRHIDGVRTVGELGELVSAEYDVAAEIAVADVAELVADLAAAGVLAVRDPA
jgi:hypothetical protein